MAGGVDPGVGAARTQDRTGAVREPGKRSLQLALHGALIRLKLPSVEARAVEMDGELQAGGFLGFHGGKVPVGEVMSSEPRPPVH